MILRVCYAAMLMAAALLANLAEGHAQSILKNRIGSWDVMCETPTGSPSEICALVQQLDHTERQNARLIVTIGRLLDDDSIFMRVTAPLGVFLPEKLGLKIDAEEIGTTPFIRCWPNGCMTETQLAGDLLAKMTAGAEAELSIFPTPELAITFNLALAGLSDALNELRPEAAAPSTALDPQ